MLQSVQVVSGSRPRVRALRKNFIMPIPRDLAKSAKDKLNEFFFTHCKRAILSQIEETGSPFVLGSFPYWREDAKLLPSVLNKYQIEFDHIKCESADISGEMRARPNLFKAIYDAYGFSLVFGFHATAKDDDECIYIHDEQDFAAINSFSIKYFNFYEQDEIDRAEKMMDDFDKMIFMNLLRG